MSIFKRNNKKKEYYNEVDSILKFNYTDHKSTHAFIHSEFL